MGLELQFPVQEDKPESIAQPTRPGFIGLRNHRIRRRLSVDHKLSSEEPRAGRLSCASGSLQAFVLDLFCGH